MAIPCLLLSLLVAVTPLPGSCEDRARMAMTGSPLIQCCDPVTDATSNSTESFRASLLPLLAALPSAAAPTGFASLSSAAGPTGFASLSTAFAPTGFASLSSASAPTGFASLSSTGRAFVRGLCFGDATVPSECHGCLSVAARNLTAGCGATTRRAGIWTERCFVAYADTHESSSAEDAFRSRVLLRGGHDTDADSTARMLASNISGPRMLATADAATPADCSVRSAVHVLAQCATDRTAAECVRCLQDSARAVDWDLDADQRDGGVAAAVVAFNCYLRFEISTSVQPDCGAAGFTFSHGGEIAINGRRSSTPRGWRRRRWWSWCSGGRNLVSREICRRLPRRGTDFFMPGVLTVKKKAVEAFLICKQNPD